VKKKAAPGLEQQLLQALIECLSAGPAYQETPAARRHRDVLARFEDLIEAGSIRRRRAMQRAHPALRRSDPQTSTVAEVAGRCGFRDLGRLANSYRAIYGELPSATAAAGLVPGRSRPRAGPAPI
jgi:AraC-like DNA-binding protein